MMTEIRRVLPNDPARLAALRHLLAHYAAHLHASLGAEHICLRDFEAERAALPGPYCDLLLATVDGLPAGCVCLKPLADRSTCEMKRLWVEPAARGSGLGRMLVCRLLEVAAAAGFHSMYLDTVSAGMPAAVRLYRELGFTPVPRYNDNAIAGVEFFRRSLASSGTFTHTPHAGSR